MADQRELFGLVASVPTAWRTLNEIAAGSDRALARVSGAVTAARARAGGGDRDRHGALAGVQIADQVLEGVICLRLDASVVPCHSPALATRSSPGIWPSAEASGDLGCVADVKVWRLLVRWHLVS